MKLIHSLVVLLALSTSFICSASIIFINEIHYDNAGTDQHEFFELMAAAGTDLTGWQVELYNGSNGATYGNTIHLSGVITDTNNGFGFATFSPSNIQNGAPDGLALIDNNGVVQQFLSYEGSITATAGAANGLTSIDIGISESSSTPANFSLQLTGSGINYQDFTWQAMAHTSGAINTNQTIKIKQYVTVLEPSASPLLLLALALLCSFKRNNDQALTRFANECS
jgi:uncharacterized protein